MFRRFRFLPITGVVASAAAVFCLAATTLADALPAVQAMVSQISQTQYEGYHLTVENMGLGLYGGASYNMGYRNRQGTAGLGSLGNQETRLYLQETFAGMGLGVTTQGTYHNVIGELPGLTNPDQIILVSAHYDHIAGDRPGGDDNASGTAGVLEVARVLSQYSFDATIRFVGFNAEEDGLLGSKDYVTNYVVPNGENIVAVLNMDMILRPGFDNDPNAVIDLDLGTRTSHAASLDLATEFRLAAADYAPSLVVDATTFHLSGGSDQDPFVLAGYPAILLIENTTTELWGGANLYYHTLNDASDRLANDPLSASGVVYDYPFATDVLRTVVGLVATKAVLVPEPGSAATALVGLACLFAFLHRRRSRGQGA